LGNFYNSDFLTAERKLTDLLQIYVEKLEKINSKLLEMPIVKFLITEEKIFHEELEKKEKTRLKKEKNALA